MNEAYGLLVFTLQVRDLAGAFWIGGGVDVKRSMQLLRTSRPMRFGRWRSLDDLTMLGKDVSVNYPRTVHAEWCFLVSNYSS